MTYSLPALTQVSNFLSASGLGLILCLLYYAVALVRSAISERKIAYFISDTVFSVLTAFFLFVFFEVYTSGEVRPELLASAGLSFLVFRYCFTSLFSVLFHKLVHMLSLFFKAFFAPLTAVVFLFRKSFKKILKKEK